MWGSSGPSNSGWVSRAHQAKLRPLEDHCPSLDSTISATPLGGHGRCAPASAVMVHSVLVRRSRFQILGRRSGPPWRQGARISNITRNGFDLSNAQAREKRSRATSVPPVHQPAASQTPLIPKMARLGARRIRWSPIACRSVPEGGSPCGPGVVGSALETQSVSKLVCRKR